MFNLFHRYIEITEAISLYNHKLVDKFTHVILGLIIWLVVAVLFRRPLDSWIPLGVVAVAAFANEIIEVFFAPAWYPLDAAGDLVATFLVPGLVALALRACPATRG